MYYVANLETHAILTYREGDRIIYVNKEIAQQMASLSQELTRHPAAVIALAEIRADSLRREIAPWFKIQRKIAGVN